eukprot:11812268-Alexandrium_andersonii.AAC.1
MKLLAGLNCKAPTSRCAAQILSRTTYARFVSCQTEEQAGSACSAGTHSTLDAWRDTGKLERTPGNALAAAGRLSLPTGKGWS